MVATVMPSVWGTAPPTWVARTRDNHDRNSAHAQTSALVARIRAGQGPTCVTVTASARTFARIATTISFPRADAGKSQPGWCQRHSSDSPGLLPSGELAFLR